MKPKHQRFVFIGVSVISLCAATLLAMQAFRENVVFFYTPSEFLTHPPGAAVAVRIGGLVKNVIRREEGTVVEFDLSDGAKSLRVAYRGALPSLFREGQGAVVEGHAGENGAFRADRVLAKHDEYYMPKEVVEALKKSGHWHDR